MQMSLAAHTNTHTYRNIKMSIYKCVKTRELELFSAAGMGIVSSRLLLCCGPGQQESERALPWLFIELCEMSWSSGFMCSLTGVPSPKTSSASHPSHGND